eukprot:6936-Heterococcus_DN1.PRE.8
MQLLILQCSAVSKNTRSFRAAVLKAVTNVKSTCEIASTGRTRGSSSEKTHATPMKLYSPALQSHCSLKQG